MEEKVVQKIRREETGSGTKIKTGGFGSHKGEAKSLQGSSVCTEMKNLTSFPFQICKGLCLSDVDNI